MSLLSEHASFFKYLLLIVIGIILFAWITSPMEVTVTGVGEAEVPANKAILSLSATEINDSPVVAKTALDETTENLKLALAQNGVPAGEIIQSQPQIIPAGSLVPGATGYAATITMGGPTDQVENVGNLTALLYDRGATLVSQPVLQNEEAEKLESEALKKALNDAKDKAGAIGIKNLRFMRRIGAIVQVDTPTTGTFSTKGGNVESEEEGQFMPSENFTITKAVQVTYRMW